MASEDHNKASEENETRSHSVIIVIPQYNARQMSLRMRRTVVSGPRGGVVSDGLLGDSRLLKRSHQHLLLHLLLLLSTPPPLGSVGRAGGVAGDRLYRPREGTKTVGRTGLFLVIC